MRMASANGCKMSDKRSGRPGLPSIFEGIAPNIDAQGAPSPAPAEQIRYPLARDDIAQVWLDGRWEWAAIRPQARGRPRQGLQGRWVDGRTFVPFRSESSGIGFPQRTTNTLEDAIDALAELSAPWRRGRPFPNIRENPFVVRGRGRPLRWTVERRRELMQLVGQLTDELGSETKALRRLAKLETFGPATSLTLRRQYYAARASLQRGRVA
jgi:hypothetical protein